jgi:hypothetical protein
LVKYGCLEGWEEAWLCKFASGAEYRGVPRNLSCLHASSEKHDRPKSEIFGMYLKEASLSADDDENEDEDNDVEDGGRWR